MTRVNLVTGGAGFIGSHLCEALLARGEEVLCLDNFFTGRKANIARLAENPRFELIRHDITHPVVLEADRIEGVMRAVWSRYGLQPHVMMRTGSLEAVRSLIGVGAAIAILPDFLYRPWTLDAQHIEARQLADAVPTIDVGLVWRRGSRQREVVQEFIEIAREQARAGRMR